MHRQCLLSEIDIRILPRAVQWLETQRTGAKERARRRVDGT